MRVPKAPLGWRKATVVPRLPMRWYQPTTASRSRTAIPTWSSSVRSMPAEERDPVLADLLAELGIVDAVALLGRQAQHADLALVQVVVDLVGSLARLLQRVDGREDRLHLARREQAVRLPRLLVVGEVRGHDALQLHPEMPVVVLDHVTARRRARDDRAAPRGRED